MKKTQKTVTINKDNKIKPGQDFFSIVLCFLLILFGVGLFYFENPNNLFVKGIGVFGWFVYIPLLVAVRKSNFKLVWFFGGIYGAFSTGLFAMWLYAYDKLIWYIAVIVYFIYFALLFLLLKIIDVNFKKNGWLVQFCAICSFEYLKTLGFAGFHYGVTAYSQWKFSYLIQITDIIGIFGLNAFVIFCSCLIYAFFDKSIQRKKIHYKMDNDVNSYECKTYINYISVYEKEMNNFSIIPPLLAGGIWLFLFIIFLVYGHLTIKKYSKIDLETEKKITVAAIQNNENANENGLNVYRKNIQSLMDLTDKVLEINPDVDMVVWPETAVVPSIVYQYKTRKDENRYRLVMSLLEYFNSRNQTFVIGNGYTKVSNDYSKKENFNSALVFTPKVNVIPPNPEYYSKIHLVPFSEFFPYSRSFPNLYKQLLTYEHNMWNPGTEYKVFNCKGLNFSTPICFEDTFPQTGRKMFQEGARCFINLSNDSWAGNLACQYQHLSMAIFRSVENKIPSVRSTSSGQTCVVNSCGSIENMGIPFCETYIIGKIPVFSEGRAPTFYNIYGDFCGYGLLFITVFLLLMKIIIVIIERQRK